MIDDYDESIRVLQYLMLATVYRNCGPRYDTHLLQLTPGDL